MVLKGAVSYQYGPEHFRFGFAFIHRQTGRRPINQEKQPTDTSPSYLYYNLFFLLFTLSVVLVPDTAIAPVRQFLSSLFAPLSSSAVAIRKTEPDPRSTGDIREGNSGGDQDLRAELIKSRLEIMNLRSMLNMQEELRRLDVSRLPYIYITEILSIGETNPWRRTIQIDRGFGNTGSKPKIVNGLAVTYGRQLIGRTHEVGRRTSRIQLITDPDFSLRVLVLPPEANLSRDNEEYDRPKVFLSRRTGILQGNGSRSLDLNHILSSVSVENGWDVISAGGRGTPMPRGLLVGKVQEVSDQYGQFLKIRVRPSVHIQKIRNLMVLRPRGTRSRNPGKR